jgi:hypothetical protein
MCSEKQGLLYSDIGGIFIGQNIETTIQYNRLYTIIFSLNSTILISNIKSDWESIQQTVGG